jgi:hypothetical protein
MFCFQKQKQFAKMKLQWIIILLFVPINSLAQLRVVKGTVTDSQSGEILVGAGIRSLMNPAAGIQTNETGKFEIPVSSNDTLAVTFVGYEDQVIPVATIDDKQLRVRMTTYMGTIQEVEIQAERIIAEEFTIRKIKKLEIYTNPAAKADPILAVNSTPSATTTDESANISLRGGSPAETGIFFNHVPINDAVRYSQLNGIGTFSVFNTALIKNVQVYPGNPPLEYGNSTSGIISLQSDETIPAHSTNTVALTLASLGIYSSRKLKKQTSFTIFSNYQPSAMIRMLNSRALKDLKKFSSFDLGMHYSHKLNNTTVIKVFNYSLRESYRFQYEQPTYNGIFAQEKIRNFTVANFRKRIQKTELSFNQGISFSKAHYNYGTTAIALNLHDRFSSFNIQRIGSRGEWKTGISLDHKASDFQGHFPTFNYASGNTHPVSYGRSEDHITNPEWYGYYKQYLGSKWIAGGGLRKNLAGKNRHDYLSLQGNIHYNANDFWSLNLSAGNYHKHQLPQAGTNTPLLIESNQYSIDLSHNKSSSETTFSVYFKEARTGESKTRVNGLEFFTRYRLNGNMRFQFSFTSLDAKISENDRTFSSPYDIHYFLRGNIEYKIRGTWTVTTVFLFRQGSYNQSVSSTIFHDNLQAYEPVYEDDLERLPSYQTVDLSISKIFPLTKTSAAIAFLSMGNLGDFKNVRTYTYSFDYTSRKENLFSKRTLYFGLIINF